MSHWLLKLTLVSWKVTLLRFHADVNLRPVPAATERRPKAVAQEPREPGSITTLLNGVLVQHNVAITKRVSVYTPLYFRTTPYAEQIRESLLRTECGPLQLQDHDSPVRFRNIWIRPLDDKAFLFDP